MAQINQSGLNAHFLSLLKTRKQPPQRVPYTKSLVTKPRLNSVLALLEVGILNQSNKSHLTSTS